MEDLEQQQQRELERRRKVQEIVNSYHRVFDTEDGKVVLKDLKEAFGLERRVFNPIQRGNYSTYDATTAALTDGGRAVVIHIISRLAAPAQGDANLKPQDKVIK